MSVSVGGSPHTPPGGDALRRGSPAGFGAEGRTGRRGSRVAQVSFMVHGGPAGGSVSHSLLHTRAAKLDAVQYAACCPHPRHPESSPPRVEPARMLCVNSPP